ncbi:MAG: hypothetical protein JW876_07875 [Candidatus Krumholzibacteriota bacterium]|nr:hypothetical protein [Candidatus Krumholzibacteriota bacterium]
MRKVFVVLMGLMLSVLVMSCSDDDSTVTPTPEPADFEITTATVPAGYTCSPYAMQLEAVNGSEPYSWSLAIGSSLPAGFSMTADGEIVGMTDDAGEWTFTIECTDAGSETVSMPYTLTIDVPENPSLAIFFDGDATVCAANTSAFTQLDCYVYIMLEGSGVDCARACEFMLTLTDREGVSLEAGSQYGIVNVTHPDHVALTMGDPFNGIAISFNRPMLAYEPIHVASFGLLLMQNLEDLNFNFEPMPSSGLLGIATCEDGYPTVSVGGRKAAVNYDMTF